MTALYREFWDRPSEVLPLAAGDTVTVLYGGTTISTVVTSGAFETITRRVSRPVRSSKVAANSSCRRAV